MSEHRPPTLPIALFVASAVALGTALLPAVPASAAASIALSRANAAAGDRIGISGFGFAGQDSIVVSANVTVRGNATLIQSVATSGANGAFNADLSLPAGTQAGATTVLARDFHGHSASRPLTVVPLAYVRAGGPGNSVTVTPNHLFYVSGQGFLPAETVVVSATFPLYNGTSVVVSKNVQASSAGRFYEIAIVTPADARTGTVTLTARGQTSKRSGSASLGTVYRPALIVSPSVVRPGGSVSVAGREFIPGSRVDVSVTIARVGTSSITLTKTAGTQGNGSFSTSIVLPGNVGVGVYTIQASDATHNLHAADRVQVTVHPLVTLSTAAAMPGESIVVRGGGFALHVSVHVYGTFPLRTGGSTTASTYVTSDAHGSFSTNFTIPAAAAPGNVPITGSTSNGKASATVFVKQIPPTPTPVPPTPTPTATPIPKKHHRPFKFDYVSIWYHTVRVGTYDHLEVQGSPHTTLGIWVHVWLPSGIHDDFYENTDNHGFWEKTFTVPTSAWNSRSNQALVTFRLWHGIKSKRTYSTFTLVQ